MNMFHKIRNIAVSPHSLNHIRMFVQWICVVCIYSTWCLHCFPVVKSQSIIFFKWKCFSPPLCFYCCLVSCPVLHLAFIKYTSNRIKTCKRKKKLNQQKKVQHDCRAKTLRWRRVNKKKYTRQKQKNGKVKCTLCWQCNAMLCYVMDLLWNVLNSLQWRLVRCGDVSSR